MSPKPLKHDPAQFKALDKSLPFKGPEAIDTAALEAFPYAYPGKDIDIINTTEEFTSVCPFSGLPDFGALTIEYTPDKKCVELRSLKYYLVSFRDVGMFYEHLANRVLDDLVKLLDPRRMTVEARMNVRGGIVTTVRATHVKPARARKKSAPR